MNQGPANTNEPTPSNPRDLPDEAALEALIASEPQIRVTHAEKAVETISDIERLPKFPDAAVSIAVATRGIIHALLALNETIAAGFSVTKTRLDELTNEVEIIRRHGINQDR